MKKKQISMTVITFTMGLMLAVQYQSVKEPVIRDTRDTWELREDLIIEKDRYLGLIREIQSIEEKINQYESERVQGKVNVLKETLNELKVEAGLTEIVSPGITINIEYAKETIMLGETIRPVSAYLLQSLMNELNQYGAKHISINENRLISTSVIREINGATTVDGHPIDKIPISIKVGVEDLQAAEELYKHMQVSKSSKEFFMENYRLSISNPQPQITIPAFKDPIRIQNMELAENYKGG
ncbi:DUF881 domain-containing protein [Niallia sp. Krafla_26]|uniref:DUF881 domain-containing protein n=1 Tax=Niallia sp. Krafla_26 TaxID=3064703 RepID=UPI003D180645